MNGKTSLYLTLSVPLSGPILAMTKTLTSTPAVTNAATPGSGSQTHMIGLTREMVGFYSFVLGIEYSGFVVLVLFLCVHDEDEFGIGI